MTPFAFWSSAVLFLIVCPLRIYESIEGGRTLLMVVTGVLHILTLFFLNSILLPLFRSRPGLKRGWIFFGAALIALAVFYAAILAKVLTKAWVARLFYSWLCFPVPRFVFLTPYLNFGLEMALSLYYWFWVGDAFERFSAFRTRQKAEEESHWGDPKRFLISFRTGLFISILSLLLALGCYLSTWWIPAGTKNAPGLLVVFMIVSFFLLPIGGSFINAGSRDKRRVELHGGGSKLKWTTYGVIFLSAANFSLFLIWPALRSVLELAGYFANRPNPDSSGFIRVWIGLVMLFAFLLAKEAYLRIRRAEGKGWSDTPAATGSAVPGGSAMPIYEGALRSLSQEGRLDVHLKWDYRLNLLGSHFLIRFVLLTALPVIALYMFLVSQFRLEISLAYPLVLAGLLAVYHLVRMLSMILGCLGGGPVLTFSPEGLWIFGRGLLPWSDLKSIQVAHKTQEKVLKFIPRNGEFLNNVPWWARWDAKAFYKQTGLFERFGMKAFDIPGMELVKILRERFGVQVDKPSVEMMGSADPETQQGDTKEDIQTILELRNMARGRPESPANEPGPAEPKTKADKAADFLGNAIGVYLKLIIFGALFFLVFSLTGLDKALDLDMAQWLGKGVIGFVVLFFGLNGFGVVWALVKGWMTRDREKKLSKHQIGFIIVMLMMAAVFVFGFFTFLVGFFKIH